MKSPRTILTAVAAGAGLALTMALSMPTMAGAAVQPGTAACVQAEAALDTARDSRAAAADAVEDQRLFLQVARIGLQQTTEAATQPGSDGGAAVTDDEAAEINTARENVAAAERNLAAAETAFAAAHNRVLTAEALVRTKCAPAPTTTTTPPPPVGPFKNCDDVRAAGLAPIPASHPRFQIGLDADRDGLGCEDEEGVVPGPKGPKGDKGDKGDPAAVPCNNTCTRGPDGVIIVSPGTGGSRTVVQPPTARESVVESDLVVTG